VSHFLIAIETGRYNRSVSFCLFLPRSNFHWEVTPQLSTLAQVRSHLDWVRVYACLRVIFRYDVMIIGIIMLLPYTISVPPGMLHGFFFQPLMLSVMCHKHTRSMAAQYSEVRRTDKCFYSFFHVTKTLAFKSAREIYDEFYSTLYLIFNQILICWR
jgi:hypothetical protein